MSAIPILPWVSTIAAPLLVAALLTRKSTTHLGIVLAPWTALPALGLALFPPEADDVPWLLLGARFGLDAVGRTFLLAASIIWLCGGLLSQRSIDPRRRRQFFFGYLLSLTGNLGALVAQDLASFYFFFVMMTYSAYALVIDQDDDSAIRAARTYIVFAIVGELALLGGMFLVVPEMPSPMLDAVGPTIATSGHRHLLTILFVLGFASKAGAIGLHMWMPPTYDAAPASAGALLSGAMAKVGLLGWLRFLPVGMMSDVWSAALATVGLVTAFYGVLVGLTQRSPKAILAYSSVSQMGLMMMAVAAALQTTAASKAVSAAAIYALHHGLAKASLFAGTGLVGHRVASLGKPVLVAGLLLPGLSLAGAPLTSGAVAKHALDGALKETSSSWLHGLQLPLSLAAAATLILLAHFWVRLRSEAQRSSTAAPQRTLIGWALVTLASATMIWGVPWLDAPELARETLSVKSHWKSTWPVLVGLAVYASARGLRHRSRLRVPSMPPGDLLIPMRAGVVALTQGARKVVAFTGLLWRESIAVAGATLAAMTGRAAAILAVEERIGWTQAVALLIVLLAVIAAVLVRH